MSNTAIPAVARIWASSPNGFEKPDACDGDLLRGIPWDQALTRPQFLSSAKLNAGDRLAVDIDERDET